MKLGNPRLKPSLLLPLCFRGKNTGQGGWKLEFASRLFQRLWAVRSQMPTAIGSWCTGISMCGEVPWDWWLKCKVFFNVSSPSSGQSTISLPRAPSVTPWCSFIWHYQVETLSLSLKLATDLALFNNLCFLLCFIVEPHPTANGSHLFAFTLAAPSIWVTRPLLHLTLSTLSLEHQSNLISSGEAILPAQCPVTAQVAWLGQCPDTSLVPPWVRECLQDWTMALPIPIHLHLVLRHLKHVVPSKYFPEWMTDWMNDSINYKAVVPLSRNQFPYL